MRLKTRLAMASVLLAACAAAAWSGPATTTSAPASAPGEFRPFVFVHASDPQIGASDTVENTGRRMVEQAERINALQPDFVVITGDLTERGNDPAELEAFQQGLSAFKVPVHVLPGNHDDPKIFRERHGKDYYAFTHRHCEFVCVNSDLILRRDDGDDARRECDRQWEWFAKALADARQAGRTHIIVALHHPPIMLGEYGPKFNELAAKHGVKHVLCGHTHRTALTRFKNYVTYEVSGSARARDDKGLTFGVMRVSADDLKHEFVRSDIPASQPATAPADVARPASAVHLRGADAPAGNGSVTGEAPSTAGGYLDDIPRHCRGLQASEALTSHFAPRN